MPRCWAASTKASRAAPTTAFWSAKPIRPRRPLSGAALRKSSTSPSPTRDALGLILVANNRKLADFDLSPLHLNLTDGHQVHGSYPNALAVSPDNTRLYVAEAGLNSVAVLDVSTPTAPKLLGRIPTGWYPSALSVSADGKTLYIVNDKGVAEDLNPATDFAGNPTASGIESF